MLPVKIFENNSQKEIVINQKHISSFEPIDLPDFPHQCTKIRMSNGDEFHVVHPPFDQWQIDAYITDQNY